MIDGESHYEVPEGWVEAPLSTLLTSLESGKRPKGGVNGISEGVPSLGGEHLTSDGRFDFTDIKYVPRSFAQSMHRGHIERGDILVVKDGATTGKTALVSEDFPFADAVANEHLFVCRPAKGIAPGFLAAFMRSTVGQQRLLAHFQGAAQGGINRQFAAETIVPVAPAAEQRRIAERLEKIESLRLSAGARLDRGRIFAERLRRSLLAAACAGRLTANWRDSNPTITADALVEKLMGVRGEAVSPISRGGAGLASGNQLDLLPPSWRLVRLGDVLDVATGATPSRKNLAFYDGGTIPWVTSGAVNAGTIMSPSEKITQLALDETNVKLFPRGALLVAMYGEGQTRGRVAELGIEAGTNQALAAILFDESNAHIRPYVRLFFEDSYWRIRTRSAGGVQPNLNLGVIRDTLLPMPPHEEQREILRRVTSMLDALGRFNAKINQADGALEHAFRAAIVKAFRGQLVKTEAELAVEKGEDFESAEDLLVRPSTCSEMDVPAAAIR